MPAHGIDTVPTLRSGQMESNRERPLNSGTFPNDEKLVDEKDGGEDEIRPADEDDVHYIEGKVQHGETVTPEMRAKILDYYGRKAEEDKIAPGADITMILEKIIEMPEDQATDILVKAIDYHKSE